LCAGTYNLSVSETNGGSATIIYTENFDGGAPTWTLNVPVSPEGADPNFFMINDDEGGVAPGGCGIAGNGDPTLHITSVFNPTGGAAYDAGGLCGILFCPEAHRRAESGIISTVGYSGITLTFDYIANGDIPNDQATVWYNTGSGWNQLGTALFSGTGACNPQGIWTAYTTTLPASCDNISTLQIAFQWDNNDDGIGTDPSMAINNVQLITTTPATGCSGTATAVLTNPPSIQIVSISTSSPSCGTNNGTININANGGTAPLLYSLDNGTTTQSSPNFSNLTAGNYTVSVIDANACQKDSLLTIAPANAPIIDSIVFTNPSCGIADGNLHIFASGGTGALSFSIDSSMSFQSSPVYSNLSAGTYHIYVKDASGCNVAQTQVLNGGSNPPTVMAGPDKTICSGTAVVLNGSGATSYLWNNGITDGVPFNQAVGLTTYIVTGTDANGCTGNDTIVVTVVTNPIVNAGADQIVCDGTSITLNGSGATSYVWDNGVTNGVAFNQAVGTTTYTVMGKDINACMDSDQVVVTVVANPIVDAGLDQTVCEGVAITLNGQGANTYTWNNGVTNGVAFNPSVGTTTYIVNGSNGTCSGTDSVTVTVSPKPSVDFASDKLSGCAPLNCNLTSNSSIPLNNCVWTFSDGNSATGCGGISATFAYSGCYDVTLTASSIDGCMDTLTKSNYICIMPQPIADFYSSPDELTSDQLIAVMTNTSTGADEYFWTFGDHSGDISYQDNPKHTFPNLAGTYWITLTATNNAGCTDTVTHPITLTEELIFYVPNTFTPDADKFNEKFQPVFTAGFDPYDYTLLIYDRYGEIIFESHNAKVGWDGTYGGHIAQDGVYIWQIQFKLSTSDDRQTHFGNVNLIR
jgi:gliding motility-associated-like protein